MKNIAHFVIALIKEGYSGEELAVMSLPEVRDLYEEECVPHSEVTVVTATANGGMSIKRVA
jgi:hypothetical protein